MKINESAIKKLAKLLDETGLTEIEVVEGEQVIRVSKGAGAVHAAGGNGHTPAPMMADPAAPQRANTQAPATVAQEHPGAVTSPMVGTAYLSSEPRVPPSSRRAIRLKRAIRC
jgi:acetyl-CoA carboxylase biotin carboxyl carrier protein